MTREITATELAARFGYDAQAGRVFRLADRSDAVYVKHRRDERPYSVVSFQSVGVLATRVIYALETGQMPTGLRTRFVDDNPTNLRRSNLVFCVSSATQPGEQRTLTKLLLAMARLGGRSSTPRLREATGISAKVPLSAYMKLLEAKGQAHVCGVDEEHTKATGKHTLMWELGPGDAPPAEARQVINEMRRRQAFDADANAERLDVLRDRVRAKRSIAEARAGRIPNSIFAVAAQLI